MRGFLVSLTNYPSSLARSLPSPVDPLTILSPGKLFSLIVFQRPHFTFIEAFELDTPSPHQPAPSHTWTWPPILHHEYDYLHLSLPYHLFEIGEQVQISVLFEWSQISSKPGSLPQQYRQEPVSRTNTSKIVIPHIHGGPPPRFRRAVPKPVSRLAKEFSDWLRSYRHGAGTSPPSKVSVLSFETSYPCSLNLSVYPFRLSSPSKCLSVSRPYPYYFTLV